MKTHYIILLLILIIGELVAQNHWTLLNEFNIKVRGILITRYSNTVFVGLDHSYVYASTDDGDTWTQKNVTDFLCIASDLNENIFVGRERNIVSISINNGNTWANYPIPINSVICFLIISSQHILAGGWGGLIESFNGGQTWQLVKDFGNNVNSLVMLNDGSILAAVNTQGVFKKETNSNEWIHKPISNPEDISFLKRASNNTVFAGGLGGIFKSDNLGEGWTPLNLFPPSCNVSELYIDNNDNLYASLIGTTDSCFYQITQSGELNCLNYDITDWSVRSFATDYVGKLYAGTYSGKLFRLSQITDVNLTQNSVNICSLSQNYPNPYNPSTTISYSIPAPSLVSLKIFNILGQEITTLVNEEKSAGNYEVNFNASNLPSGVYIYKMKAGEYVQTRKMILLK